MNTFKYILLLGTLILSADCVATIIINIPTCNIDQQCGLDGRCANNCIFGGLNKAGTITTLPIEKAATRNDMGQVTRNTKINVLFEKKSKQVVVTYQPTVGRLKNKQISLLFQMIDLADTEYIEGLPKDMRADIAEYSDQPNARYVLFLFKGMRKNIWMEISQTYLKTSSKDKTNIPITVQPDGNIHVTQPGIPNIQPQEDFYIKIEQIS